MTPFRVINFHRWSVVMAEERRQILAELEQTIEAGLPDLFEQVETMEEHRQLCNALASLRQGQLDDLLQPGSKSLEVSDTALKRLRVESEGNKGT
jgi:hypothetical protein